MIWILYVSIITNGLTKWKKNNPNGLKKMFEDNGTATIIDWFGLRCKNIQMDIFDEILIREQSSKE